MCLFCCLLLRASVACFCFVFSLLSHMEIKYVFVDWQHDVLLMCLFVLPVFLVLGEGRYLRKGLMSREGNERPWKWTLLWVFFLKKILFNNILMTKVIFFWNIAIIEHKYSSLKLSIKKLSNEKAFNRGKTLRSDSKYFIIKKTGGVTFQSSLSQSSIYDMELQANLNCSKNFVDSLQLEWVAMEWCFS